MPWTPGDPWPGPIAGGAASPNWGGYVRLFVRAGLAPGQSFHMGAHANDRLDAGNVLGGASIPAARAGAEAPRLWVDLSCDVLDVDIAGGATSSQGIFSKADAATAVVTLADPAGIYDPLNADTPFAYGGRSRLIPGTPVEVFAEVIDDPAAATPTVTRHFLFSGTADSWGEDWTPKPWNRVAKLTATDSTKRWVRFDRPEVSPVGAGDTTAQRVTRIVDYYAWSDPVEAGASSAVTLEATTLAQNGWELLNRTLDDELGYVYFAPNGNLRWVDRAAWFAAAPPAIVLGCDDLDAGALDVLVDAEPSTIDAQLRNAVYAARSGGTSQTAISQTSIDRFGEHSYQRTDLGVATDPQAGEWARVVVQTYAFPMVALANVTMRPAIDPASWDAWNAILDVAFVTDLVRVIWAPPDIPEREPIDVRARVVGFHHAITRAAWETVWQLAATGTASTVGAVFTLGPHAQDRLDAAFVMGG